MLRSLPWVVLGLAGGIGLGLFLGWVAWPTTYTEADLTVLEESYQRDIALMIAATYSRDGDLIAARRRLADFGKEDTDGWLLAVTVDTILNDDDEVAIRQIVALSYDLGLRSPAMEPYLSDSGTIDPG